MPRYLKRWSRWCQQAFFLLVRCCCSLTGCGKSLNRDDSPPQGLKPSLILHDLRGAKAQLYHSAAGFSDFFRSLLEAQWAIGEPAIEIIRVPPAFPPFQILRGYCLCVWLKRFHR